MKAVKQSKGTRSTTVTGLNRRKENERRKGEEKYDNGNCINEANCPKQMREDWKTSPRRGGGRIEHKRGGMKGENIRKGG